MKILHLDSNHELLITGLNELGFINHENYTDAKEQIETIIHQYDGIILRSRFKIDKGFLEKATKLKFIGRVGAGLENIDVEFFIVKRKLFESDDFVIRRIQKFKPPSGKVKLNKATQALNDFLKDAFDLNGYKKTEHKPKSNNNCKWCVFHKTHLCSATY
jgi:hypothetical protein